MSDSILLFYALMLERGVVNEEYKYFGQWMCEINHRVTKKKESSSLSSSLLEIYLDHSLRNCPEKFQKMPGQKVTFVAYQCWILVTLQILPCKGDCPGIWLIICIG